MFFGNCFILIVLLGISSEALNICSSQDGPFCSFLGRVNSHSPYSPLLPLLHSKLSTEPAPNFRPNDQDVVFTSPQSTPKEPPKIPAEVAEMPHADLLAGSLEFIIKMLSHIMESDKKVFNIPDTPKKWRPSNQEQKLKNSLEEVVFFPSVSSSSNQKAAKNIKDDSITTYWSSDEEVFPWVDLYSLLDDIHLSTITIYGIKQSSKANIMLYFFDEPLKSISCTPSSSGEDKCPTRHLSMKKSGGWTFVMPQDCFHSSTEKDEMDCIFRFPHHILTKGLRLAANGTTTLQIRVINNPFHHLLTN